MSRPGARLAGSTLPCAVRVGRRVRLERFGGIILVMQRIGGDVTIRQSAAFAIARPDALQDRKVIGIRPRIGAGAVILGAAPAGDVAATGANAVCKVPPVAVAVAGGMLVRAIACR